MARLNGQCVVMGVKAKPSDDGKRTYRSVALFFPEDCTTLEANVSEEHVQLFERLKAHTLKPATVVIDLREFSGKRFHYILDMKAAS